MLFIGKYKLVFSSSSSSSLALALLPVWACVCVCVYFMFITTSRLKSRLMMILGFWEKCWNRFNPFLFLINSIIIIFYLFTFSRGRERRITYRRHTHTALCLKIVNICINNVIPFREQKRQISVGVVFSLPVYRESRREKEKNSNLNCIINKSRNNWYLFREGDFCLPF